MPERGDSRALIERLLPAFFVRNRNAQRRPDQPDQPISQQDDEAQNYALPQRVPLRIDRRHGRGRRNACADFHHHAAILKAVRCYGMPAHTGCPISRRCCEKWESTGVQGTIRASVSPWWNCGCPSVFQVGVDPDFHFRPPLIRRIELHPKGLPLLPTHRALHGDPRQREQRERNFHIRSLGNVLGTF